MNPNSVKLFASLMVIVFVVNPMLPAVAAAGICTDHPCCCRANAGMAHQDPSPSVYSVENGCCSDASMVPCNLNTDYGRHSSVFTVSNSRNDLHDATDLLASAGRLPSGNDMRGEFPEWRPFQIAIDPVPIYLHNLVLIC